MRVELGQAAGAGPDLALSPQLRGKPSPPYSAGDCGASQPEGAASGLLTFLCLSCGLRPLSLRGIVDICGVGEGLS